jgi:hypothetical protein
MQWRPQRIEVSRAVTSELHRAGWKILDGKASGIKFNGDIIVTSKLFDGN